MSSELGHLIRTTRQAKTIGLRELARTIAKSPSFLVALEMNSQLPGVTEDTLKSIAHALDLEPDELLALARKTPKNARPRTQTEVALYRLIQNLSPDRQAELKGDLEKEIQQRPTKPKPRKGKA